MVQDYTDADAEVVHPPFVALGEVVRVATLLELDWRVESWVSEEPMPLAVVVQAGQRPVAVSLIGGSGPSFETGPGTERGDGEFEYGGRIPSSRLSLVLVLGNAVDQREVRIISGNAAAVAAFGWRDDSAGRRAPVGCSKSEVVAAMQALSARDVRDVAGWR